MKVELDVGVSKYCTAKHGTKYVESDISGARAQRTDS